MRRERKSRALERVLGEPALRKGDELVFFCPKCSHRKPKLSVNVGTDWFHCWICEWSGKNLTPILRMGGDTEELRQYVSDLEGPREERPARTYDVPVLPKEFRSLSREWRSPYYADAVRYLGSRGVGRDVILRWRLGYCEDGEYRNRVVIPSFDVDGELNFFVGRSFYRDIRTYKHGNFDKDVIFNELDVNWDEPVVLTEGPFDAMKAGDNAIPLQGSFLRRGSRLFRRIVTAGRDVYFAMDADAVDKQMNVIAKFLDYGVRCLCVPLGGRKDVGEMTRDEFFARKAASVPIETRLDLLRVRAYQ